ncbi:hypothetical protein HPP92_024799 [Vanilla planifolia]|uniref:Uncharacterized protein n=1 Tax=Vanilla planifolia TaxID=51239 RepID=A0A835PPZ8_VANPL|nr:hypothetical protein HPP92_024799 [Vanilla planifolia]
MDGDGSFQLLQAAAAANHAQAIVIIFLEEYDKIFDDDLSQDESSSELYTESEDDEDAEDEESTASGIPFDDRYGDVENEPKAARKVDPDCFCDGTPSASEVGSDIISEDGSYLGTDVSSNIGSGGDSNTGSNVEAMLAVTLAVFIAKQEAWPTVMWAAMLLMKTLQQTQSESQHL